MATGPPTKEPNKAFPTRYNAARINMNVRRRMLPWGWRLLYDQAVVASTQKAPADPEASHETVLWLV
jgi:hypothetical protein